MIATYRRSAFGALGYHPHMMVTPDEAVATLERGDRETRGELERLTPRDLLVTGIGGGEWSPKDLIGHLALWHEIALRTIDQHRAGTTPWIVGVFTSPGDGPNDEELALRAPWPLERARDAYEESRSSTISAVKALRDPEWSAPVPGWTQEPATIGGLLGVVLGTEGLPFGHAFAHLDELRVFADERVGGRPS
jgi:hypothetical protein